MGIQLKLKHINNLGFAQKFNYHLKHGTNSILEIAASVWEEERYDAFKMCYQSMRVIDDLIDNHKVTNNRASKVENLKFIANVHEWVESITGVYRTVYSKNN